MFAVVILLQLFTPLIEKDHITSDQYLLSAISQGLAALFALVFTISIIVLQVSYRYKGLFDEFFNEKFNIFYPILNGIGIIFPILVLKLNYYYLLTNIAIGIASMCVFMVLPFFLRMKEFIKYNVGIRQIFEHAQQAIDQKDLYEYKQVLHDVFYLSVDASRKTYYTVIRIVLEELLRLSKYSYIRLKKMVSYRDGVVQNTLDYFCQFLEDANKTGILRNIWYVLHNVSTITDDIPSLSYLAFTSLFRTLIEVTKTTPDTNIKRMSCCSTWVLAAKWLTKNQGYQPSAKKLIINFTTDVGKKFVLECNNPNKPKEVYENAAAELYGDNEERQMLDKLRSWVKNLGG